jgi:hypothetical protein
MADTSHLQLGTPHPPSLPAFPFEIIEIIVDHLHKDTDALFACSLTSHAFLAASRFHIWEWVTFHPDQEDDRVRIVGASVSSFVRGIHLKGFNLPCVWESDMRADLHAFTALKAIQFSVGDADDNLEIEEQAELCSIAGGLRDLRFVNWKFQDWDEMVDYIALVPLLEQLHLENVHILSGVSGITKNWILSPSLRSLVLVESHIRPFLSSILTSAQMAPLHTLRLTILSSHDLPLVGKLLSLINTSLMHLELTFPKQTIISEGKSSLSLLSRVAAHIVNTITDTLYHHFNLESHTNLRTISLGLLQPRPVHGNNPHAKHVPLILSTIKSHHVERVEIKNGGHDFLRNSEDMQGICWFALASVLQRPEFSRMRRLAISLRCDNPELLDRSIRNYLAPVAIRGILQLHLTETS